MKALLDDTALTFGKYIGQKPNVLADDDPNYIVWLYENVNPKACTQRLYDLCLDVADSWEDAKEMDDFDNREW